MVSWCHAASSTQDTPLWLFGTVWFFCSRDGNRLHCLTYFIICPFLSFSYFLCFKGILMTVLLFTYSKTNKEHTHTKCSHFPASFLATCVRRRWAWEAGWMSPFPLWFYWDEETPEPPPLSRIWGSRNVLGCWGLN